MVRGFIPVYSENWYWQVIEWLSSTGFLDDVDDKGKLKSLNHKESNARTSAKKI